MIDRLTGDGPRAKKCIFSIGFQYQFVPVQPVLDVDKSNTPRKGLSPIKGPA